MPHQNGDMTENKRETINVLMETVSEFKRYI